MNSIERFYATINRKDFDRPAAWLGIPDKNSLPGLYKQYKVDNVHDLKLAIGDDFYAVELPYHSEYADAIYAAFNWYGDERVDSHDRTLTDIGCFSKAEKIGDVDFEWPDPKKYINPKECRLAVEQAPDDKVVLGILWSSHFQDTCAAFGMENALVNMIQKPELYKAVDRKILDFYLEANKIFLEATKGKVHAVLIGNDMGSQRQLMISPEMVREFIMPGVRELVNQIHSYGIKVIYHSCGSIADIIGDLFEAGVDAVHPIQAKAAGMDPKILHEKFGNIGSFAGGVDTQDLLVNGTPEEVVAKVKELRTIFKTGLIISPSHEAILPDVPPENIEALFKEATKIY